MHAVNKQWHQPGLKFPWPLGTHKHELSKCSEFLQMSPDDRWNKIERRRICFTCIQPKSVCNGKRCIVQESLPIGLLCKGCELDAVAKGWAPLNILLCRKKEHVQLRAPWGDIRKDLEKYFGKLSTGSEENSVKVQCNFICNVFTAIKHSDGTEWLNCVEKKPKKYKSTPLINSSTGERIEPDTAIVIPETKEHSFYLSKN